jgi:hypothetical protein
VELSTRLDEPPTDPEDMVGAAGIEPATLGLEIRCSIRLSYAPALINTGEEAHCRKPYLLAAQSSRSWQSASLTRRDPFL